MSNSKLIVLQKKISKFLKRKFLPYDARTNGNNPGPSPKKVGETFKILNNEAYKAYCKRLPNLNEKSLISILRYLNLPHDLKFSERPNIIYSSKNFWKLLFPQSLKDERKLKATWVRSVGGSTVPKLSRGFIGSASHSAVGRTKGRKPTRGDLEHDAFDGARRDRGDISEQNFYTKEYIPNKRPSLKRPQKEAGDEENLLQPPPSQKCRLSCPLPPPEFFPPEKTPYISSLQPPYVRFPTLQSEFLLKEKLERSKVEDEKVEGKTAGKTMVRNTEGYSEEELEKRARKEERTQKVLEKVDRKAEGKLGKSADGNVWKKQAEKSEKKTEEKGESKGVEAEVGHEGHVTKPAKKARFPPSEFPEFMQNTVKNRKNYLNLKTAKSQLYGPEIDVEPKMRALLFQPMKLSLNCDSVDAPTKIFKDEILVQVAFSGVCGFDFFITEGRVGCGENSIILGHEISGKVYAVGSAVTHVKPGDNVAIDAYTGCYSCRYCTRGLPLACSQEGLENSIGVTKNGGWAEFVVVNKTQVHKVPEELGLDQAALSVPLSCILSAMSKLKLSYGMQILIQGLGLTGTLWATVLHARGFHNVFVCDKNEKRRTDFDSLNLNYGFVPPEDIRKFSADVVIECTGNAKSIENSFNVLNPNGQVCLFGKPSPNMEIRYLPYEVIQKEITIVGTAGNAFCFSEAIGVAASMGRRYLDFEKLGVKAFDLEDFKYAFQMKKSGEISKIVFKFDH